MLIRLFLTILFSLCLALPATAGETVKININGSRLATDVDPVIMEGRTLVPVRAVSDGFGADVLWDGQKKQVIVEKNDDLVILVINDRTASINSRQVQLDVPPQIVSDRTMVPARFIGESLGAKVDWDETNRMVIIEKHEADGGLTPEQVLEKSMTAMDAYDSYRFKGNLEYSANTAGMAPAGKENMQSENMQMQMNMEGEFKKPSTVYLKMDTVMSQKPEDSLKVEMWTDGSAFFMNNGKGWKEVNSFSVPGPGDNPLLGGEQNPAGSLKMIKECGGIVSFTRNDEDYYRVRVVLNTDKLFEQITSQEKSQKEGPDMDEEALEAMAEFVKQMKFRLMYDFKIHRKDFITESMQIYDDISIDLSNLAGRDAKTKTELSGIFNLYDYDKVLAIAEPVVKEG